MRLWAQPSRVGRCRHVSGGGARGGESAGPLSATTQPGFCHHAAGPWCPQPHGPRGRCVKVVPAWATRSAPGECPTMAQGGQLGHGVLLDGAQAAIQELADLHSQTH